MQILTSNNAGLYNLTMVYCCGVIHTCAADIFERLGMLGFSSLPRYVGFDRI